MFIPDSRTIKTYLAQIGQYKLFTKEDEHKIGKELTGETCLERTIAAESYIFSQDYGRQAAVHAETTPFARQWTCYEKEFPTFNSRSEKLEQKVVEMQKIYKNSFMHYQRFLAVVAEYLMAIQPERKKKAIEKADLAHWNKPVSAPIWGHTWKARKEAIENLNNISKKNETKIKPVIYFSSETQEFASTHPEVQDALYRAYTHVIGVENWAKELFITSNLRLAVSVAKKYIHSELEFEDTIQYGNIGLMRSVETFDYERGYKFSTYATWWIKQSIIRGIENDSRIIRIPVHFASNLNKLPRFHKQCREMFGREPTHTEYVAYIAQEFEISPQKAERLLFQSNLIKIESLDKHTFGASNHTLHRDLYQVPDAGVTSLIHAEPVQADFSKDVTELNEITGDILAEKLDVREEKIIRMRYGIGNPRKYSLEEVGAEFNLTRERIRQIELKALKKLKDSARVRRLLIPFKE